MKGETGSSGDGTLDFADEPAEEVSSGLPPWTILIVDDEDAIHEVTQLALADISFEARPLHFLSARSAAEGRALLAANPEIALVLLDVVMETDTAGLDLVRFVRSELGNALVRIVLRTGQPGQAPERRIIVEYDVSDYKTKIELTSPKLFTTVVTALRLYRQLRELAEHRQRALATAAALRRFFPGEFLRMLGKSEITEVALGDQIQREMTVMFADIRGFTARSADLSPADCFAFINRVFAEICPIVRAHHGFIDKFLGDGFLALFPESAEEAVQAALAIQRRLSEFNAAEPSAGVRLGIGLHTGPVMLGTVGEPERMEATVLSDVVNLAARVEALTKQYGASVVLSEQTLARIDPHAHELRSIGQVRVPGKRQHFAAFELIEADPERVRERKRANAAEFTAGLERLLGGDFAGASVHFKRVLDADPADEAARLYLQRAAENLLAEATRRA